MDIAKMASAPLGWPSWRTPEKHGEASRPEQRVALVTAGQVPRSDVVAYVAAFLPASVTVVEYGALDGLTRDEIRRMEPRPGELSISTSLASGERIVIARQVVEERMRALLSQMAPGEFDLVVLLSTGFVRDFGGACPVINMQRAVDTAVSALIASGQRVGLIQPIERQTAENELGLRGFEHALTWLESADEADYARVAAECSQCEILVLNSISFDEQAGIRLGEITGKPVILPRRVIAGAARMLLDVAGTMTVSSQPNPVSVEFDTRLSGLTPREREVMWLMVEGLQSKAIARQLGVSPRTVEIHRTRVLSKIGVGSTNALIHLALRQFGRPPEPARITAA